LNILNDIITYVRRIIKSPSNATVTDALIVDYINRFWLYDVDARVQLFDLKKTYSFQTTPGVDKYNMPLYSAQSSSVQSTIATFPVYQGFFEPSFINGIRCPFYTQRDSFYNLWPNFVQNLSNQIQGDGTTGPYTITIPYGVGASSPNQPTSGLLRGHVDMMGIIASGSSTDPIVGSSFNTGVPTTSVWSAITISTTDSTGANMIVQDSGQFLDGNVNYGLLMSPGQAPFGNQALTGGYSTSVNTVNYNTGVINLYFPNPVPSGQAINIQCYWFNPGLPRAILYHNNTITLRSVPSTQYTVELDGYLTPAAFLNTGAAIPFGYMSEYIARGAARKMLSDNKDDEQFNFYEPLFREQESLVWKRSQRQFTATRTPTIYSQNGVGSSNNSNGLYGVGN
jgi:hypothetical protein